MTGVQTCALPIFLRVRGEEVASVEGGSARLVEEGVYLIQTDENEVKAVLRPVLPG